MKILFPDNWHFHSRNFAPIFKALKLDSIDHQFETTRHFWWKAHGDYEDLSHYLESSYSFIDSHADWENIQFLEVNLWELTKAEFLCAALTRDRWHQGGVPNLSQAVFDFAFNDTKDRVRLRNCLAATHNWLNFWDSYFTQHRGITHTIIFSGSYIYSRALIAIAKKKNIEIFIAEHFFTGNDFYLEPRTEPIANFGGNSLQLFLRGKAQPSASDFIESAYAHLRIKNMRNRNVPQGFLKYKKPWKNNNPVVLIVGQVVNDFSLAETPSNELSSIAVYKHFIGELLNHTNANIIFKSHPWERKKKNLRGAFTREKIAEFIQSLPTRHQARIQLAEIESIQDIFKYCDGVAGISSQGLLEACKFGFKPLLLAKTFFSNQGFTHDCEFISGLIKNPLDISKWRLSLDQFNSYEYFMIRLFTDVLIPNDVLISDILLERLNGCQKSPHSFQRDYLENNSWSWKSIVVEFLHRPLIYSKYAVICLKNFKFI